MEGLRFVDALCRAGLARNRTAQPLPVHITASTGAVSQMLGTHPSVILQGDCVIMQLP